MTAMTLPRPECEVLLHSLHQAQDGDTQLRGALSRVADWESLERLALKHHVFPSLYRRLADTCPEAVPPEVLAGWGRLFLVHARRNLRLTGELLQVLAFLTSQEISAIPYKGPILAQTAYGDLTLRQFVDLDILVRGAEVEKVKELLVARGYRLPCTFTRKQDRVHRQQSMELNFQHARRAMLEVHWRFQRPAIFGGGLDPEEVLARRVPARILGEMVYIPCPEDNLLILCVHGSTHLWSTLSMVSDVTHLVHSQNNWNWPRLLERAKDSGLRCQTLLGLSLARDLLGAAAPPEVIEEADADPGVAAVRRKAAQNLWVRNEEDVRFLERTSFYLQTRDSFKDRVRHVWGYLAIPNETDWQWLPLPDSLYGLYFVIRPLRQVFKCLIMPAWRRLTK